MKEIKTSGLPIFIDEETYKLDLRGGLTCAGSGGKIAGQLKGLLYTEDGMDEKEYCYDAYRDIVFDEDRSLFRKFAFRSAITVIMPERSRENVSNLGHSPGYIAQQPCYTFRSVAVLVGKAVSILQK